MAVQKAPGRRTEAPDAVEFAFAGIATADEGSKKKGQRQQGNEDLGGHLISTSIVASSSSKRDVRIATVAVQSPGEGKLAAGAV